MTSLTLVIRLKLSGIAATETDLGHDKLDLGDPPQALWNRGD